MSWGTTEQPILEAIEAQARSVGGPRWEDIVEATGLPAERVQLALRRLREAGYIDGIDVTSMGDAGFEVLDIRLLEPGLRSVGTWPADSYEELVNALRVAIADEDNPVQKSRLERLLAAATDVGQSVLGSVLADVAKKTMGL